MDSKKSKKWQLGRTRMLYLGGGAVVALLGLWGALLWSDTRASMGFALMAVLLLPLGGFLLYRGVRGEEKDVVIVGAKKPTKAVNSLNIYARKDELTGKPVVDRVAFEMVKKPMGQPQECVNKGVWYFVHIFDLSTGKLKPFVLPDSQFFDPSEFGNVLEMPAHRRLFEHKASTFQKVAPWVMLVAFLISVIAMVAVGG